MPRQDQPGSSQRPSRRAVLYGAAGAGAAGVAVSALSSLGGAAFAAQAGKDRAGDNAAADQSDAVSSEQFVVHVRDAATGQIDVFRSGSQIRIHDRELARRLDRLSRS